MKITEKQAVEFFDSFLKKTHTAFKNVMIPDRGKKYPSHTLYLGRVFVNSFLESGKIPESWLPLWNEVNDAKAIVYILKNLVE